MNKKGFTLIEMLGCLALLGIIFCIGLYSARGTLATSLSMLTDVSENEIYNASKLYVSENGVSWTNVSEEEYTCLTVQHLVDEGYFEYGEVNSYDSNYIKIIRNPDTRVIDSVKIVDSCE